MDDVEYTPETMRQYKQTIDSLYHDLLCIDEAGADPESEQFFLLALNAIDMSRRYLEIAGMRQSRALAGTR